MFDEEILDNASREYLLHHLAGHLAATGRWEELHTLVAEGEGDRQEWAEARHGLDGSYAGYFEDLRLVWAHTDNSEQANSLPVRKQMRYALIESSIRSLANNFSADLLRALLLCEDPNWPPEAVLGYASLIPEEYERTAAFRAIAPFLPPDTLLKAFTAASRIKGSYPRARALASLFPSLSDELQLRVFEEIVLILAAESACSRAGVLIDLIPSLPKTLVLQGIDAAWQAAKNCQDVLFRNLYPQSLAWNLPDHVPTSIVQDILEEIWKSVDEIGRAYSLLAILPHLEAPLQDEVSAELLTTGRKAQSLQSRAGILIRLVPFLPQSRQDCVLNEAISAALAVEDHGTRSLVLTDLIPHVPKPRSRQLLVEASDSASRISDPTARANALLKLIPLFDPGQNDQLMIQTLELCEHVETYGQWVLSVIVPMMSRSLRTNVLQDALTVARRIGDHDVLAWAIIKLATISPGNISEQPLEELIQRGLGIADASRYHAEALAVLASVDPLNIDEKLMEKAFFSALAIKESRERAWTLAFMAPELPTPLRKEAIENARLAINALDKSIDDTTMTLLRSQLNSAEGYGELLDECRSISVSSEIWEKAIKSEYPPDYEGWISKLRQTASKIRKDLVGDLMSEIFETISLTGVHEIAELIRAIKDVDRWWP